MGFVEEIRDALRRPPGLAAPAPDALVDACRQIAHAELTTSVFNVYTRPAWKEWSEPATLRAAVDLAWCRVSTGLFGHRPDAERAAIVYDALRGAIRRDMGSLFGPERPEVPATLAQQESLRLMALIDPIAPWRDAARYLVEVGALDPTGSRRTALGDLLLRLPVRELVVGLLHAEACQSLGRSDRFRIPRWVFRAFAQGYDWHNDPLDLPEVGRLVALGVLDEDEAGLGPVRDRVPWLVDAADERSPLGILVRSTVDDQAATAIGGGSEPSSSSMQAVTDLAEIVSHELGNTLASLELTIGQIGGSDRHLERLRGISQRLRTFAAGIAQLAPGGEPLVVVGLLDVLNDALRSTTFERNGHLTVSVAVVAADLRVQRSRVQLAFENLVRNAAQAARGAGRACELRVRAAVVDDNVEIVFEDDGPGVPAEVCERLFERGVSGRGGSGLGLALTRVIAAEHHGSIHHEAPDAGGARFVLRLPTLGVWT